MGDKKVVDRKVPFITKTRRWPMSDAAEQHKLRRVLQLASLGIYHENAIKRVNEELRELLKQDVENIDY